MSDISTSSRSPRKRPRYAANVKVEMFTKGLDHVFAGQTANISKGGLFICTDHLGSVDETLHLRIILSDKNAFFSVKTRVAWVCLGDGSHPQGLGVEFIDISPDQAQIIDKFLIDYVNVTATPKKI